MKLAKQVKELAEKEKTLRQQIFAAVFPEAKEGTNKAALPAGWMLEADQKYNRNLDSAALPVAIDELRKLELSKLMVSVDALFKYSPDIVVSELRKIEAAAAAEQRAADASGEVPNPGLGQQAMEALALVMTVKPGLPSLKITAPKAD